MSGQQTVTRSGWGMSGLDPWARALPFWRTADERWFDGGRYAEAIRGAREMRAIAYWSEPMSRSADLDRALPEELAAGSPPGWITRP